MANINARSPYLINHTSSSEVTLKVWIYTGTQLTSHTSTPTYTLTSTPVNSEVTFDISPLVKDYFEVNFDGNYSTEILWVDYQIDSEAVVQLTGYYGYGYFEDGANPNNYTGISNGVYNFISDSDELDQNGWGLGSNITLSNTASGDSYSRACKVTQSSGSGVSIYYNLDEALPAGQEVTVSCWVIYTDSSGNSTRNFQLGYANGGSGLNTTDLSVTKGSGWQFISHTFIVPDTYVSIPRIRFNSDSSGASGDVYRMYNCAAYIGQPNQGQMSTYGQAGVMKTNKRNLKLSVDAIYKPENETFNLGVTSDEGNISLDTDGTVKAYESGVEISSFNTTIVNGTGESDEIVNYIKIPVNADAVELDYWGDFKDTVYVHNTYQIPVYSICEPKYTPYKLTFINRYGILEDLWFFKNSKLSLETKEESYRANIVSGGSYSISNHQYKTLYKEGKESLTINSGFYPESHNEAFKQLLLSEQVWINYKGQTLPCKIKDSSISFQDRLTEKNINYTMNIEFSFDKINNVR